MSNKCALEPDSSKFSDNAKSLKKTSSSDSLNPFFTKAINNLNQAIQIDPLNNIDVKSDHLTSPNENEQNFPPFAQCTDFFSNRPESVRV